MRLVIDTSVIVAALRSPKGASAEILRLVRKRKLVMLASVGLFVEYEAVLKRTEHLNAAGLSNSGVDAILNALAALAEPIDIFFLWRPKLRDANDDMVLEIAVNGNADAIVTFNVRDFSGIVSEFGIPALLPADVLSRF
jgi:putative PIN family toxin of toxin-antitoxin system